MCTPDFLVRIVTGPGSRVAGEAYLLQAHFTRPPDDTAGARIDIGYEADARAERASLRCSKAVRSKDNSVDACRIGLPLDWKSILTLLDTSGVLATARDTGYHPMPPGFRPATQTRDPMTGRETLTAPVFPGCGDIGSETVVVEILDGDRYRTAGLWCMEARGPVGQEHYRAAIVRRELMRRLNPAGKN